MVERVRRVRARLGEEIAVDLTRRQARELIEAVREYAQNTPDEQGLANLLARFGVHPLIECPGEAHRNPHIDNCALCAPRWGWVGESINVTSRR